MAKYLIPDVQEKYEIDTDIVTGEERSSHNFVGYEIPKNSLLRKVQVPTMISYTVHDDVVDGRLIESIARLSPKYFLNEISMVGDNQVKHGYYVQALTRGEQFSQASLYKNRINKSSGRKYYDPTLAFLSKLPELNDYMAMMDTYRRHRFFYGDSSSHFKGIRKRISLLLQVTSGSEESFRDHRDYYNLSLLSDLLSPASLSFCRYLHPNNSSCEVLQSIQNISSNVSNEDQQMLVDIFKNLSLNDISYPNQIFRVGESARKRMPVITIKQAQEIGFKLLRKYFPYQDVLAWHTNLVSQEDLIPDQQIPWYPPRDQWQSFNLSDKNF
jgi:hypothetical protein